MDERGLIEIYTGDGKGKTTAATGLAVRALGQGLRVLLVRFLKPATPESGEVAILRQLPGIEILDAGVGVIHGAPDPATVAAACEQAFAAACERIAAGAIDLAIFDEANNALYRGHLALKAVLDLCDQRPVGTELVFTGRHAPAELLARADLITEMTARRHPLASGVAARRGIEF